MLDAEGEVEGLFQRRRRDDTIRVLLSSSCFAARAALTAVLTARVSHPGNNSRFTKII